MDDLDYIKWRGSILRRNMQYAKPDWNITTFESDKEEEEFRNWVESKKIPFNPEDPYPDYDLRGFYKALKSGDEKAVSSVNKYDKKTHYPDYWKTPFHETFSNESKWATKNAPRWNEEDQLILPNGIIIFDPKTIK